jgi:hypothetical protein
MGTMTVWHLNGDRFAIGVRDHMLTVDQPLADGGEDTAPTPTELLVASLASCVAFYARRYLARAPPANRRADRDSGLHPRAAPGARRGHPRRHPGSRRHPGRASRRAACRRLALHRAQHAGRPPHGHSHAGGRTGGNSPRSAGTVALSDQAYEVPTSKPPKPQ